MVRFLPYARPTKGDQSQPLWCLSHRALMALEKSTYRYSDLDTCYVGSCHITPMHERRVHLL